MAGAEVRSLGIARDTFESVRDRLAEGASRGRMSWSPAAGVSPVPTDVCQGCPLRRSVGSICGSIASPGKPLAFGRAGNALMFGLPGNRLVALVTFELFRSGVHSRLSGHKDSSARNRPGNDGRRRAQGTEPPRFLRVRLAQDATAGRRHSQAVRSRICSRRSPPPMDFRSFPKAPMALSQEKKSR